MTAPTKVSALICGGGPAGLAAALLLRARGWRDIVLVERRPTPDAFERSKSFNYQLDGRGQRLLSRLGIEADALRRFGLANDHFTLTNYFADGREKQVTPPILVPDRKTPYWMTRSKLLLMLQEELDRVSADGSIQLLFGHKFESLVTTDQGTVHARVTDPQGTPLAFCPQLLLGCDGLWSQTRAALADLSGEPDDFEMHQYPSPSTGLTYKVLHLPPRFKVGDNPEGVNNHEMAYAFHSTYQEPDRKLALFALPAASPEDPRSVNIILKPEHQFWQLNGVDEVTRYLSEGFPQLDIPALVDSVELKEFAELKPGQFPAPQYTRRIYAALSAQDQHGLLLGDAAHSFPPDLGLGVNSALEDLAEFELQLEASEGDLGPACEHYQAQRIPESKALVKLVQTVHPYQYGQDPLRLKLWIVGFAQRLILHKLSFGLLEMPGFMLSQKHRMSFTEILRRFRRGNLTFYGLWLLALVTLVTTLVITTQR